MDPQYTYDLTLKPASGQYVNEVIASAHNPVLIDGCLIWTEPDGKTCIRVLSVEPTVFEVEQVQSGVSPTAAQEAGTYRHKLTDTAFLFGANLDDKVDLMTAGLTFDVKLLTSRTELGIEIDMTGVKSLEIETGVLRIRHAQAGVYRHFNLTSGGVRCVEVTPVQV